MLYSVAQSEVITVRGACCGSHRTVAEVVCAAYAAGSCPPLFHRVLSHSPLLASENVTASSGDTTSPTSLSLHWCLQPQPGHRPHLLLSFTQPVVVEQLMSTGTSSGYVDNFSIEVSSDWTGRFTAYQDTLIQQVYG